MKQSKINQLKRIAKSFDRKFGKDNWCFYNQSDEAENTSLIVADQAGFCVTAFCFSDDELIEIHEALGISDKTVFNTIMSSVYYHTANAQDPELEREAVV